MLRRIFLLLLIACFTTTPLRAETDPFVGQWKLIKFFDRMIVTKVGANKYGFDFGGGVETIVLDGTQQPGYGGTTLSVGADGTNWTVIRKKGNHVLLTATWALSKDDNLLKDNFTSFSQDGTPSNVKDVYRRRSAGSGFVGTWVNATGAVSSAIMLQVRPYDSNGLSFIIPSARQTINVNFDGKDYPSGAGSASSGRRLNARVVEIIRKSNNKITQTRQIELSPDLKTLTMTVHMVGKDQPYIYVFERQ